MSTQLVAVHHADPNSKVRKLMQEGGVHLIPVVRAINWRTAAKVGFGLLLAGCVSPVPTPEQERKLASFVKIRPVLERSCVHCHAAQRMPGMPSITNTQALSGLIGAGNLIVPGSPERSRFFQVVTLSNEQTGAMPPTGHALSKWDVAALRTWILEGALVPDQRSDLTPKGVVPRST